jgi:hypothetical protein
MVRSATTICLILVLACAAAGAAARDAPACVRECGYEPEPVFDTASVVEPALLSGPDFTVDPKTQLGGYMAHFAVTTPWGPLNAESTQMLAIRVGEVPAIEALDRATHSGAFAQALAARGKKTGMAVVHVVEHPVDSVVGLPMGVVRYFKKVIDTWTGRAQSAGDHSQRTFENKGDPFRAPDGPMVAGRDAPADAVTQANAESHLRSGIDNSGYASVDVPDYDASDPQKGIPPPPPEPQQTQSKAWYARAGREVDREAKRYMKYNTARNEIAKRLGFDPNTSNPFITERLNSLAWAATWGNFSAGEALGDIDGVAAEVITDSGLINQFVLTHTPEQVRERNQNQLSSVCSDVFGMRQFLSRGGFSDTLRTQFTDSLVKLAPKSGCDELLELGAATHGEVEARFLVDALSQIRKHNPNERGGKLIVAGASVLYITHDGKLLLPLPVDYLSWDATLDEFFKRPEFKAADKTVLIGGGASMLVQRHLSDLGWSLALRAPYDGMPKYPAGEFDAHFSRPP